MLTKEQILQKCQSPKQLSKIKTLSMWGCDIEDISILSSLPNLEIISLSVNKISSLAPLSNCTHLRELYLRKNQISSLEEINNLIPLKDLRVLWLEENPISSLNNYRSYILSTLPQLIKLDNIPVDYTNSNSPTIQNDTINQIQKIPKRSHQQMRKVASFIQETASPKKKHLLMKKDVSKVSLSSHKDDCSFRKFCRIDSMCSFGDMIQYFKEREHSISPDKDDVKKKGNVKIRIYDNKEKKNKDRYTIEDKNSFHKKANEVKKGLFKERNKSDYALPCFKLPRENNAEMDITYKENNKDYILKAIIILVNNMKKEELVYLNNEIDKMLK